MTCSERILEQKRRALLAKEALEQEHVQRAEQERRNREVTRSQSKARRIAEAQRAQQRAALDLQQKTTYFQVLISPLLRACSVRDTHVSYSHHKPHWIKLVCVAGPSLPHLM